MDNPYKKDKYERSRYFRYRYAMNVHKLNHDDCIKYANTDCNMERKKIAGTYDNGKPRKSKYIPNHKIHYESVIDPNYPVPDKNNILSETKAYIFYKDKVWSKCRDHYLRIQNTKTTKYVMIRDPITNASLAHKLI